MAHKHLLNVRVKISMCFLNEAFEAVTEYVVSVDPQNFLNGCCAVSTIPEVTWIAYFPGYLGICLKNNKWSRTQLDWDNSKIRALEVIGVTPQSCTKRLLIYLNVATLHWLLGRLLLIDWYIRVCLDAYSIISLLEEVHEEYTSIIISDLWLGRDTRKENLMRKTDNTSPFSQHFPPRYHGSILYTTTF